jgi:acetyl esterase/lipase
MNNLRLALFAVLCCNVLFSSCQPPKADTQGIDRRWLDLSYATLSTAQKLDIYLPNEGNGPFPVIVSIHGGAFKMGDKGDFQVNAPLKGLQRGYAVVSVNYRLSGEAIYPAQIQDVKAAIRFIRANARKYKLDPARIAIWGGSAGGNLAAMAGVSGDVASLEDLKMGNAKHSSRVQAVVDWFGPINFNTMDEQFKQSGKGKADHNDANSPESLLIGKPITEAPNLVKIANPSSYISPDDPAFFIEHGEEDHLVPTEQSILFAQELEKVLGKEKVTLKLLPIAKHGGKEFESAANLDLVFAFLDKHLKKSK